MKTHLFIDKATKKPKIPNAPEYQIHCAIADYLNLTIKRPLRWMTVEVSNQQSGNAGRNKQMALKRKGVVTGTPDIFIFWNRDYNATLHPNKDTLKVGGGLKMIFLEVKVSGGKLTDKQEALHKELRDEGHNVFVTHSAEETKEYLKSLGVI